MLRTTRKFVAVLLAIWLPLFSGNALAAVVAMPSMSGMSGDCQHMGQAQHQDHVMVNHDQATDQKNSPCDNSGTCHFACSGYMVTTTIKVVKIKLPTQAYTNSATQFHSFTTAPLDPPPLARA